MCGDPGGRIEEKPPAALSYAQRADFITGLPVYFIERPVSAASEGVASADAKPKARRAETEATGFRCICSGTSLTAGIVICPFIGLCKALKTE